VIAAHTRAVTASDSHFMRMQSMTPAERAKPELLAKSASRRRRNARGAGRTEAAVTDLLATFTQMRMQMKTMSKMMAQSGQMAGLGDDELMNAIADGVGATTVPPGLVRRKRVKPAGGRLHDALRVAMQY
jgi:signal recognition particle subunit SRP54